MHWWDSHVVPCWQIRFNDGVDFSWLHGPVHGRLLLQDWGVELPRTVSARVCAPIFLCVSLSTPVFPLTDGTQRCFLLSSFLFPPLSVSRSLSLSIFAPPLPRRPIARARASPLLRIPIAHAAAHTSTARRDHRSLRLSPQDTTRREATRCSAATSLCATRAATAIRLVYAACAPPDRTATNMAWWWAARQPALWATTARLDRQHQWPAPPGALAIEPT